jgi:hypothetical protein
MGPSPEKSGSRKVASGHEKSVTENAVSEALHEWSIGVCPTAARAKPVIPTISETQNHAYARAVEPYTSGHVHFSSKMTHMDLTGRRFGTLTVLTRGPGLYAMKRPSWICRCDCGKKKIVNQSSLLGWPGYRGTTTCGRNCPFYKGARQK